jgi:hypothetical protein
MDLSRRPRAYEAYSCLGLASIPKSPFEAFSTGISETPSQQIESPPISSRSSDLGRPDERFNWIRVQSGEHLAVFRTSLTKFPAQAANRPPAT